MFQNLTVREQAYYLTRIVYRDTVLEDYHSRCITMDDCFYCIMYAVVDEKIREVVRYHSRMLQIETEKDAARLLKKMTEAERKAFLTYAERFQFIQLYKSTWDPAELLTVEGPPENLAKFILDGHFAECCRNKCPLDDRVMCYINKDIHNRIYTLLMKGMLG